MPGKLPLYRNSKRNLRTLRHALVHDYFIEVSKEVIQIHKLENIC